MSVKKLKGVKLIKNLTLKKFKIFKSVNKKVGPYFFSTGTISVRFKYAHDFPTF